MSLASFDNKMNAIVRTIDTLPRRLAVEAVNFSKDRFRAQNWVNHSTEPWKPRKRIRGESARRSSRGVLISSGRLRRSIRVISVNRNRAVIGTDVPYARAHNYGHRGKVQQNVRSHQRRGRQVRAHTRTINQNLPRRQFIGESAVLGQRLSRLTTAELTRIIR